MQKIVLSLAAIALSVAVSWAQSNDAHQAPPTPPPIIQHGVHSTAKADITAAATTTIYSIGKPTGEEQLYLEMINRARANPTAEGLLLKNTADTDVLGAYTFFHVDLNLLASQFAAINPAPPLAINAKLIEAARGHSMDMFNNVFQGHTNFIGGAQGDTRLDAVGYQFQNFGENVYASAKNVFYGHAGFEVDWGIGVGGMQTPPGHRNNDHAAKFREVGIGIVLGNNSKPGADPVGPQVVTQDFATQLPSTGFNTPFITGVAYFDLNGNNFYDIGEGIGNMAVKVQGQTTEGITATSGGYAVPVQANGTYTVTFSGPNLAPVTKTVGVDNLENSKLDLIVPYTAPTISGSLKPAIGRANAYTFAGIPGASSYDLRTFELRPASIEGAENGSTTADVSANGVYDVFDSAVKAAGSHSFHMVHLQVGAGQPPTPQTVTLKPTYLVNANGSIQFQSRLGVSTEDEKAVVQVSTDDGVTWETVYTQAGSTLNGGQVGLGEQAFSTKTVSLAPYVGKLIKVRFVFDWHGGSFIPDSSLGVGWYVDEINLVNEQEVTNIQVQGVPTNSFTLSPTSPTAIMAQVRGNMGDHVLPFGPTILLQPDVAGPEVVINSIKALSFVQFQIDFELRSGKVPPSYTLQGNSTASATGWSNEANATITPLGNNKFRATTTVPRGTKSRFYRIAPNL